MKNFEYQSWKGLEVEARQARDEKKAAGKIWNEWNSIKPRAVQQEIVRLIDAFRDAQRTIAAILGSGNGPSLHLERDIEQAIGTIGPLRTARERLDHSEAVVGWLNNVEQRWHTILSDLQRRLAQALGAAESTAPDQRSISPRTHQGNGREVIAEHARIDQEQASQLATHTTSGEPTVGNTNDPTSAPSDDQGASDPSASAEKPPTLNNNLNNVRQSDPDSNKDAPEDADGNEGAIRQQVQSPGKVMNDLTGAQDPPQDRPGAAIADRDSSSSGPVVLSVQDRLQRARVLAEKSNKTLEFCQGRPPESQGWVGGEPLQLGEGGWGIVMLFLRQNEAGMIIDRVVAKDAMLADREAFAEHWHDDKPTEVVAMQRVRPLKGSENTVTIRNWLQNDNMRGIRIFMEFCPYGDIWSLMMRYRHHNPSATNARKRDASWLPEPFLWYLFESLAITGLLLHHGDLGTNSLNNWDLIVHRDLKPTNVMLGVNDSDIYKGYPQVKMGDFGHAMIIPSDAEDEEKVFTRTNGYSHIAPEERNPLIRGLFQDPLPLTSKTNVWGVGDVMWSVLSGTDGDPDLEKKNWFASIKRFKEFSTEIKDHYSKGLLDLIMSCLECLPNDRPTFEEILATTRKHTGDEITDYARGLRHSPASDSKFLKYGILVGRERYALGLTLEKELREISVPKPPASSLDTEESNVLNPDFEGAPMIFDRDWNIPEPSTPSSPNYSPLDSIQGEEEDQDQDESEGDGSDDSLEQNLETFLDEDIGIDDSPPRHGSKRKKGSGDDADHQNDNRPSKKLQQTID